MIVIIGLGNPGKKFENTWHNLGFLTVESFKEKNNFPPFKLEKKFQAELSKGKYANQTVLLVKPQTFMNNSGISVKKIISHYKKQIKEIWVIHDDFDFLFGKIKIVKNKGSAGHKGVQSIIDQLKTKNFTRFRMGIKMDNEKKYQRLENLVLKKFNKREEKFIKDFIQEVVRIIEFALENGLEKAMSKFNKNKKS